MSSARKRLFANKKKLSRLEIARLAEEPEENVPYSRYVEHLDNNEYEPKH